MNASTQTSTNDDDLWIDLCTIIGEAATFRFEDGTTSTTFYWRGKGSFPRSHLLLVRKAVRAVGYKITEVVSKVKNGEDDGSTIGTDIPAPLWRKARETFVKWLEEMSEGQLDEDESDDESDGEKESEDPSD